MNQAKWIQAKKLALARDGHCIRCLGEPEVAITGFRRYAVVPVMTRRSITAWRI